MRLSDSRLGLLISLVTASGVSICLLGCGKKGPVQPQQSQNGGAQRPATSVPAEPEQSITNSIGMELVLIPAGEFMMGNPESPDELVKQFPYAGPNRKALAGEQPLHRVKITQPYYLGSHEVTRGQFRQFVTSTNYRTDAEKDGRGGWGYDKDSKTSPFTQKPEHTWRSWGHEQSDEEPVVNVSWNDAVAFCQWLSEKENKMYRLPTEAEWEYACRAGTKTRYHNGDDAEELTKVGNVLDAVAKEKFHFENTLQSSDGSAFMSAVGRYPPNAFGLYDMHGNAAEWCSDWYDGEYYAKSPAGDPGGAVTGDVHVVRGGGWDNLALASRSAARSSSEQTYRDGNLGFRVLRVTDP